MLHFFTGGLSWYVYDAGQVIATKIAKKPLTGIDTGNSLVFQEVIHSWVGYELVKVLNVFGLQLYSWWCYTTHALLIRKTKKSADKHTG